MIATMVAIALPLAIPEAASAHSFVANSGITINQEGHRFSGSVFSPRDRCTRGRTVKLFKKRQGRDRFRGSTTTNRQGNWSLRVRRNRGRIYAVVEPRTTGGYGHSHLCRGDTSPTV